MSIKPAVRRTYGKSQPSRTASSSSSSTSIFLYSSSPSRGVPGLSLLSSSPGQGTNSGSGLKTPEPSSPTSTSTLRKWKRERSPRIRKPDEDEHEDEEDGKDGQDGQDAFGHRHDRQDTRFDAKTADDKCAGRAGVTASMGMSVKSNRTAQSTLRGFFAPLPKRAPKRVKHPLKPSTTVPAIPCPPGSTLSSVVPSISSSSSLAGSSKIKPTIHPVRPTTAPAPAPARTPIPAPAPAPTPVLTQTHLTHLPLLHTCEECHMSYVRGGEDESMHSKHHSRVVRGIVWDGLGRGQKGRGGQVKGKGKGKGMDDVGRQVDVGWRVVRDDVRFGRDGRGKIILAEGSWGGAKLNDILCMVDTVLSASALPRAILDNCKVFLLVTASPPLTTMGERKRPKLSEVRDGAGATPRERVVGVVVAQRIRWAMRVLRDSEQREGDGLKIVDSGGGVICDPKPLPTNLGIHRLFTVPSYRGHNLAQALLDTACKHTIYGLPLSPGSGQIAFSQPTDSGRRMMERWGGGAVRVFVDDESQL